MSFRSKKNGMSEQARKGRNREKEMIFGKRLGMEEEMIRKKDERFGQGEIGFEQKVMKEVRNE